MRQVMLHHLFQRQAPAVSAPVSSPTGSGTVDCGADEVCLSRSECVAHTPSVQFGNTMGLGKRVIQTTMDGASSVFRPVAGVLQPVFWAISVFYVAEFLALDVMGRLAPRLGITLNHGLQGHVEGGDAHQAAEKPPLKERLKGVDWGEMVNEFMEEMIVGPGLLVLPSVVFALMRKLFFAKSASELGRKPLENYSGSLISFVKQYEKQMKKEGRAAFKDSPLTQAEFKTMMKAYFYPHLISFEPHELKYVLDNKTGQTVGQVVKEYAHLLSEYVFRDTLTRAEERELREALEHTEEHLEKAVKRLNRDLHPEYAGDNLIRAIHTHIPFQERRSGKPYLRKSYRVVEELPRFADLSKAVYDLHLVNPHMPLKSVVRDVWKATQAFQGLTILGLLAVIPLYIYGLTHMTHSIQKRFFHHGKDGKGGKVGQGYGNDESSQAAYGPSNGHLPSSRERTVYPIKFGFQRAQLPAIPWNQRLKPSSLPSFMMNTSFSPSSLTTQTLSTLPYLTQGGQRHGQW